ncbi:MAG: gamma carbonic anhydrase family protein [Bdellovibrionia bacterium]
MIESVRGKTPVIGEDTYIHPSAVIIGDVRIGKRCSIWPNVVIRGDVHSIDIGDETNIQDGTIVHATYEKHATWIGPRVNIGHGVILHGCRVEELSLIGMQVCIMDGAVIPKRSLVGAGSLVTEGATFESSKLILGRPAKAVRALKPEENDLLDSYYKKYLLYKTWYSNKA